MTLRCLCLAGSLVLVSAQVAFAQGVPRKPCVVPNAPYGCNSTLPSAPASQIGIAPAPERRQALARVPLNEPEPKPVPEGTVSVEPASPDAKASVPKPEDERPR